MTTTTLQEIEVAAPRRKWPRYPEYKPSGTDWLANVPKHWAQQRLKWSLTALESGARETGGGNILDDGVFSIGGEHIGWNGDLYFDPPKFISDSYFASMQKGRVRRGDVLLVKDGATIGKLCHITDVPFGRAAVNEHVYILRSNYNTDSRFLFYFLQSIVGQQAIQLYVRGSAQPGLSAEFISRTEWRFPPLDEQRKIAAFLDREIEVIDDLIEKKVRMVQRIEEKWMAYLTQMVTRGMNGGAILRQTGVPWCTLIPDAWSFLPLRRFVDRIEQGWSPQAEQRIADEDEWAVLKVGAVLRGRFRADEHKALPPEMEPETRFELREGDLLLTRGNTPELVADVCVVPQTRPRLMLSDLHYRLTLNESKLCKRFTCYWLLSRVGRDQIEADAHGTSNSMVKVSQQHIRSWFIAIPPREEQDAICGHLDGEKRKLDAVVDRINQAIHRLREYRAALITAAVTGQIDVRQYGKEAT
jgi:type I restriction enzyme S subunit